MNDKIYIDNFIVWKETAEEKLPDFSFVPPMIRRRMSDLEKIAVGLAGKIAPETPNYTMVFASRFGEWGQTIRLIKQFFEDNEMSPAGFSNSVHNAAVGLFSLLTKNKNSYTSIAAGDDTLEMAVLKALTEKRDVMVVFVGEHNPEMYDFVLGASHNAYGIAFMIKTGGQRGIKISKGSAKAGSLTFETMVDFLKGNTNTVITKSWIMQND
ncbi:MAG: beta-ketoacyl synthase chain length factor [Alphaproteobacteria bacterium]|nr:beta-ketoacyl synthase chain length factor [Alphaproteobacteria bacterium]